MNFSMIENFQSICKTINLFNDLKKIDILLIQLFIFRRKNVIFAMQTQQDLIVNVKTYELMFTIIMKFRLHLNKDDNIDNILSYVFFKKDFRD